MAKQDDYARYTIRIPKDVYSALEEAASAANRSVNAEIVERLSYAVEHPRSHYELLLAKLHSLASQSEDDERTLEDAQRRIDAMAKAGEKLSFVAEQGFDFQRKLMYHVLNYVDEIPAELAIWAYDVISAVERTAVLNAMLANPDLNEQEARKVIKERRDAYRREALAFLKQHLADLAEDEATENASRDQDG
ncbi:Arc-like DNA binding dprotein [Neorhizobium sp. R1-B]|uniref:Arc family DNA-binding protein n=1 Tax=Neorhizobium sp. R1-B TaxID=2485162 RepID=UPI0010651E52|nr:Arc family DNA-binding protein [Neorhizobium sp. R1-B]TDX77743.1 Arc-like DNA binding dprotein [Neorhizobium sp. R1-B]